MSEIIDVLKIKLTFYEKKQMIHPYKIQLIFIIIQSIVIFNVQRNVSAQDFSDINELNSYEAQAISYSDSSALSLALNKLITKIADKYQTAYSSEKIIVKEDMQSSIVQIISTYRNAINNNITKSQVTSNGNVTIICRLSQNALINIFKDREKLAINIYRQAANYEKELELRSALKYYYYSLIIMKSLPYDNVKFRNRDLTLEIPQKIEMILQNIEFQLSSDQAFPDGSRSIILSALYDKNPITSLEVYYVEDEQIYNIIGRDGKVCVNVNKNNSFKSKIVFQLRYSYETFSKEIPIVYSLWKMVIKPQFMNYKEVQLSDAQLQASNKTINLNIDNSQACVCIRQIESETKRFLRLLEDYTNNRLTDLAFYYSDIFLQNKINRILQYNDPINMDYNVYSVVNKTFSGGWEVRRIPVLCRYPTLKKNEVDYLILDFSNEGVLLDVNFSVYNKLYDDFVLNLDRQKIDNQRQEIIKFLEKYRTAYLCRDMYTIEKIFHEDALIIVGRVIKNEKQIKKRWQYNKINPGQPTIEYIFLKKYQYLQRLNHVFNIQHDIHLGFLNFELEMLPNVKAGVYGISMRQNYSSTTYSDEGYLFLLIDFFSGNPQIHVRAWQPNEWDDNNLIRLLNYRYLGDN